MDLATISHQSGTRRDAATRISTLARPLHFYYSSSSSYIKCNFVLLRSREFTWLSLSLADISHIDSLSCSRLAFFTKILDVMTDRLWAICFRLALFLQRVHLYEYIYIKSINYEYITGFFFVLFLISPGLNEFDGLIFWTDVKRLKRLPHNNNLSRTFL